MQITLGARPTEGRPVEDVTLRMPLPDSCVSSSLTATVGVRAKQMRHFHDRLVPTTLLTLALLSHPLHGQGVVYDPIIKEVEWHIGRIPKDKLPVLSGTVLLGPGRSARELSLSLFVTFKVTMYSASGLKDASLRVENEEYQPYKGVRSITRAGTFEVRC